MTGSLIEGAIVLLVVVLNAMIGYYQERKADDSLSSISKLLSSKATVESENGRLSIDAEDLIPGDRVYLAPGDIIPADLEGQIALAERTNMAYSGTQVQSGTGKGIVVEIGSDTEIGKINASLATIEVKETPLLKKVNEMNHAIFKGIGVFNF